MATARRSSTTARQARPPATRSRTGAAKRLPTKLRLDVLLTDKADIAAFLAYQEQAKLPRKATAAAQLVGFGLIHQQQCAA